MQKEKSYTNEKLQKKCNNNFELAKYAIEIAKDHMAKGEPRTINELIEELEQSDLSNVPQLN